MSERDPSDKSLRDPDRLEKRVFQSGAVVLVFRGAQLVVGLGTTMVLARLLRPSDFGLLAMAAVLQAHDESHVLVNHLLPVNVSLGLGTVVIK